MRITRTEQGVIFSRSWKQKYTETYTQPLHNILAAWFYHSIWEKTLGLLLVRIAEQRLKGHLIDQDHIPPCCKVDLRCHDLHHRNRIKIKRICHERVYKPL